MAPAATVPPVLSKLGIPNGHHIDADSKVGSPTDSENAEKFTARCSFANVSAMRPRCDKMRENIYRYMRTCICGTMPTCSLPSTMHARAVACARLNGQSEQGQRSRKQRLYVLEGYRNRREILNEKDNDASGLETVLDFGRRGPLCW